MKSRLVNFSLIILVMVFLLLIINYNNAAQIKPTENEIALLYRTYGNIDIKNEQDIIRIQNSVLTLSKHNYTGSDLFILKDKLYSGLCFDRSIILQKILYYNKISFRPVYLYHSGPTGTFLDIVLPTTRSHAVVEAKLGNKYFVVQTNSPMDTLREMGDYLKITNPYISPNKTFVCRYLSNRHGRFLAPSFLPDIYSVNF